jgi:TolA-binding protein
MAIRRSLKFRFDYYLKSLPTELLGKRCEHLMRAAEKEVEQLEKKAGLPFEPEEGNSLRPVSLPSFRVMQRQRRLAKQEEVATEKQQLEQKVEEVEVLIKEMQERLKELNKDIPDEVKENSSGNGTAARKRTRRPEAKEESEPAAPKTDETRGAIGPDGEFVEFPEYDGVEPPKEPKKAFTLFCVSSRKEVKASLSPVDRKNKVRYDYSCEHV